MNDDTDDLAKLLWDYLLMHQTLVKSDAIVALGSMDTRVAARAAELWHQGIAPVIVVAGGFGRMTRAGTVSEAQQFKQVLLQKAVPEDKILIDDKSTNTAENYTNATAVLNAQGIEPKTLTIVTKPYMERRAYATCRKMYPDITAITSSPQIRYEDYPNDHISKDLMLNILVGDTQRIKLYAEKGYMLPQDVPPEVEQAMQTLIRRGFDKQLAH